MKQLSITILAVLFVCCNGLTNASIISIGPTATGYGIDYERDGIFDKFYCTPRDEDVRVGLPTWGEARGYTEFRVSNFPKMIISYRNENGQVPDTEILYLDKIYLRRWWFSGSNEESKTSVYGYIGNGRADSSDVYKTNLLIKENVGRYGSIDVTDFVTNLIDNNTTYAGFVLQEKRNGILLNYGSFYLDATYIIPEPTALSLLALGAVLLKRKR